MSFSLASACDRITLNVGGRLFETTITTLQSSGSHFFAALLGDTGAALAGSPSSVLLGRAPQGPETATIVTSKAIDKDNITNTDPFCLFIDRDADVFADVLFFMRSHRICSRTRLDLARLEDLKLEAQFYAYDLLITACMIALRKHRICDHPCTLASSKPSARVGTAIVHPNSGSHTIDLNNDEIVYIVSATLVRNLSRGHFNSFLEDLNDEPIDCTSDFQLLLHRAARLSGDDETVCIAHMSLDCVSEYPASYDFRQHLRLCLDADENNEVVLDAAGSWGGWHVVYWVGHPDAIPDLMAQHRPKRQKLETTPASVEGQGEENARAAYAVAGALLVGSTVYACTMLGAASIHGLI